MSKSESFRLITQRYPQAEGLPHRSLGHRPKWAPPQVRDQNLRSRLKACDRQFFILLLNDFVRISRFPVHTIIEPIKLNGEKILGQSLSQLYIHLSFSTKSRKPAIIPEIKEKLHSYMAGTLNKYESPALIINSVPDHIHILFRLSKNYALSKIVEEIKKGSSKWMKRQLNSKNGYLFSLQTGYSAFSVSGSKVNTVKRYIARQEEHHQKVSFKEEIETFMKEYDVIEYNPEYFWD